MPQRSAPWLWQAIMYTVVLIIAHCDAHNDSLGLSAASRLARHLHSRSRMYDSVRPVVNSSASLTVHFGIRLIQVGMDERDNVIKTSVWVRQVWYDEYLTWDKKDFEGIDQLVIPSAWIWTPDIVLVNTAETGEDLRQAKAVVHQDGRIFWLLHEKFNSACLIDDTNYPFDHHKCDLWFQSLAYEPNKLDIRPYEDSPLDLNTFLSDFKRADEWEVVRNESAWFRFPREVDEHLVYSDRPALRFSLTLRRRTGFTAYMLSVPCIVLGCMSAIVFMLPPERPDRHSVATALLGTFILLLLLLVTIAPPSAVSTPKLGLMYAANIGLVAMSLFLSSLVIQAKNRSTKSSPIPKWIEKVFLGCLGKIFLASNVMDELEGSPKKISPQSAECDAVVTSLMDAHDEASPALFEKSEISQAIYVQLLAIRSQIYKVESGLCNIKDILASKSSDRKKKDAGLKWGMLAVVLDRMFLSLQVILIGMALVFLFPKPEETASS